MARIIIIAVSKRPDGYCVAGIDYDTGEVVRPVPATGDGIPPFRCVVDGKFLALRQIVEMDLGRVPRDPPQFQRENRPIRSWKWSILSRAKLSTLEQYIDDTAPVLHTPTDRVYKAYLEGLPPQEWKSLQLIKPSRLTFGHHYFDANRWVAEFNDSAATCTRSRSPTPRSRGCSPRARCRRREHCSRSACRSRGHRRRRPASRRRHRPATRSSRR